MLESLRNTLQPLTSLAAKPFLWIHPNILSILGIFVFFPGMYFYYKGNSLLGSLFVLGALFDALDGTVARITGKTSQFGGVLDATIDRITEGIVYLAIGAGGLVPWELIFATYICSIAVSYIKAKAEAASGTSKVGKNKFSVGIGQRGDRIAILLIGSIANYYFSKDNNEILLYSFWVLFATIFITLVWRSIVIWEVLKEIDKK